jgi:hypothetical protein
MISARGSLARRALVGTLDLLVPAPAPALITMPIPAPSADGRSPAQVRCEVTAAGCFDATDHTARVARPMPTPAVIRRERRGAFAGREPISVVATRPAAVPAAGCSCIAPVAAAASAAPRPSGAAATADTPARNPARRVKRPIRMSGNARSRCAVPPPKLMPAAGRARAVYAMYDSPLRHSEWSSRGHRRTGRCGVGRQPVVVAWCRMAGGTVLG